MPRSKLQSSDIWEAALLVGVGAVIAALSAAVLITYHGGPAMLALTGVDRLQYDTAWVFACFGLALMTYSAGLRTVSQVIAGIGILVGLVRIVAYVFPLTIGVRPILANPGLPFRAGEYNAMGVLTALVAVILGSALVSLRPATERGPWRSVALAVLASIALALSLLMAFAAWSGSGTAAQSLQLAGDERVSALLFLVVGAAVLALALFGSESERLVLGRAAPFIVFLAVFASSLVLWAAAVSQETRLAQRETERVAQSAGGEIERDLAARIDVLERLGDRLTFHAFSADIWQREGASLLRDFDEFRSLAWSGPDFIIRWTAPPSDAVGFNIMSDPKRAPAAALAVRTHATTLSNITDLVIGGKGVLIYVPVFVGEEFRGMVSGVLGKVDWLRSLIDRRFPNHDFELLEGSTLLQAVAAEGSKATPQWTYEVPLAVANAQWTLRVTPTREFLARANSPLPLAGLAVGFVLATLLGLSTYFFQTTRRRARELDYTNLRLTGDIARRQHAEQALRESEQRTQLIINAVKDCAIYMLDTEGRIASWNRGAQAINGYTAAEIIGKRFSILYPSDRKTPPEDELAVATRRGWFEEECWHVRKDGSRYCGDDIISAIRDEAGTLRGFAVVTRDATPRVELREQTERARDHYFSLFSGFPNLVWRSDPSGACDYVNQAWLDHTGRKVEDEVGQRWMDHIHPDDQAAWRDIVDHTFPQRKPFELEFRLRHANGAYGSMICSGRPYHAMNGEFAGYLCSCYDNTARRATEDALKESEERYQRMTTNVPGMVFKLQRDAAGIFQFLYASHGSVAVTGLDPQQVTADFDAVLGLLEPADRAQVLATLKDSGERLAPWNWAGRLRAAHEAIAKWISIRAKPRHTEDGATVWDGVVFDDTQNRLAQLEIERSREELRALSVHLQSVREEEKSRIAREVHDELGSTLTALRMDLDWLRDRQDLQDPPTRDKYAMMRSLVESAVSTTRKIVTDLRPSILDDLGLASALRWQIGEYRKHTDATLHLTTPEPDVPIDRERGLVFFRIFQETMTNVLRYAKATEIRVTLSETDDAFVLQTRDNGIGIAAADITKLTSHGIRGMRERAQGLGGAVLVVGEPGKGTTVTVSLPKPDPNAPDVPIS
ncbi:MAG: PAS domain S-box protein [Casimicrobiaceae bacterium]